MRKYFNVITLLISFILLVGCNNVKFEEYNGENLRIGVIGEIPNVREDIITFDKIEFNDLSKENELIKYDGIFIIKDNLEEASKKEYSDIYKECVVPFFFIESDKGYLPFMNEDLTYEEVELRDPPPYAAGIIKNSDGLSFLEYGLYNDTKHKRNIEDVYSRIFTTISDNKKL